MENIKLSPEFKKGARKAVLSIVLFFIVYLILAAFAVSLAAICTYWGIMVISFSRAGLGAILLGGGIILFGLAIFFFVIKFIFQSNKVDRSHLKEIKRTDEPEIFTIIEEIAKDVNTQFPKKVYLSHEVNASVFYDSSFWSMFLPIRKNLQIGLGLINSVTVEELKGILSHEFGHFSQDSMKVGSFVYNVNHIIFNMLYENEAYGKFIRGLSGLHIIFYVMALVIIKIVQLIQLILQQMYKVVNINYMALSREMEFHADEVAANVSGSMPLRDGLLRLDLASHAFNAVFNYYDKNKDTKSSNVYKEQKFVLDFLATEDSIPFKNGFPQITLETNSRFNKSKLVVDKQWASHPSDEERVKRLDKLNIVLPNSDNREANDLFRNIEKYQEIYTEKIFKNSKEPIEKTETLQGFETNYKKDYFKYTQNKIFNSYYDNKTFIPFDVDNITDDTSYSFKNLFSDEKVDLIYTHLGLNNDINLLQQIASKEYKVKTFDYDGKKYKRKEAAALLKKLKKEEEKLKDEIVENDTHIYTYFNNLETKLNVEPKLHTLYTHFFACDTKADEQMGIHTQMISSLQFISTAEDIVVIKDNLKKLKPVEDKFRESLAEFLNEDITDKSKENIQQYLAKEWDYFGATKYSEDELNKLFTAIDEYYGNIVEKYITVKKKVIDYQAELEKKWIAL